MSYLLIKIYASSVENTCKLRGETKTLLEGLDRY